MKAYALAGSVLCFGQLASGCQREAPPVTQEAKAPTAGAVATASPAPSPAASAPPPAASAAAADPSGGKSRYDEGKFVLVLEPSGDYAAGKNGTVNVVLTANPPFHINQQYPYKFKAKEGPGVKFASAVVGKDAAKVETQRITMPVAFATEKAGKATVMGQFLFSVCTDETCLMEKRDLALALDVK